MSLCGAASTLMRKALKWDCPLNFNDPFDLRQEFSFSFSEDDFFEHYKNRSIQQLRNNEPVRKNADRITCMRALNRFVTDDENEAFWSSKRRNVINTHLEMLTTFKMSWFEQVKKYRVLCLSEEENHPLMWAHYGDMHRGAVIKLKSNYGENSHFIDAKPVTYSKDLPHIASLQEWIDQCIGAGEELDDKAIFHRIVYTKSEHWHYENEWRCIVPEEQDLLLGQVQVYNIHPEEIDSVIFGCRSNPHETDIIKKYCAFELPHIKFFKAEMSKDEYRLTSRRLD